MTLEGQTGLEPPSPTRANLGQPGMCSIPRPGFPMAPLVHSLKPTYSIALSLAPRLGSEEVGKRVVQVMLGVKRKDGLFRQGFEC